MRRRSTQPLKRLGEDVAAGYLQEHGFTLVARNWRTRFGELDLVAMDGPTLVFVEVKARRDDGFIDPALGVDHLKQQRLRRLARAYLAIERPRHSSCRFDVVAVTGDAERVSVRHIPNAF